MVKQNGFGLSPGDRLTWRYEVIERIGAGAEGEVYKISEKATGLTRAAKLYFDSRHGGRAAVRYARKLDALRDCDIVVKYLHTEEVRLGDRFIDCLISEYFDGAILEDLRKSIRGGRMPAFEALNLIYELTRGVEEIHARKEFHGDLHAGNIFVERRGVAFHLRTIDFHDWGRSPAQERRADILAIARLLYDLTGGREHYRKQIPPVKEICLGLRSDLILKKFPSIFHLRAHLETFEWA
ncbi:MAG: lipopolysaccharide kinase InaA family protein [Pseudomonadota bacterium]